MLLFFKRITAYLPTPLPVGVTEMDAWMDDIIALAGPYADADSMKWAIATMVLHMGSNKDGSSRAYVPKMYFVNGLRKSAANQVASAVFQSIKAKQQAAEATASNTDATSVKEA